MSAAGWDPDPQDREYFRERGTGQLGWRVERDGKAAIRLDRVAQEIIVPLDGNWVPDHDVKELSVAQLGQICFDADRSLCRFIGLQQNSRVAWVDLSDDQRIAWMRSGPSKHPLRKKLWEAIHGALQENAQ